MEKLYGLGKNHKAAVAKVQDSDSEEEEERPKKGGKQAGKKQAPAAKKGAKKDESESEEEEIKKAPVKQPAAPVKPQPVPEETKKPV